jgi:phenylpropionate dioxygenase-like ring-hydroxylating dioxygenase large terminal subunit
VQSLANPGDYVTLTLGRVPVLLLRDSVGVIRAYANVCRHRGHAVATGSGNADHFICPYHAWNYGLDGVVRLVPRARLENGFCAEANRLPELAVANLGPLIFVHPRPASALPFADVSGRLPDDLVRFDFPLDRMRFHARFEHPMRCNWKVYMDNVLECYHCPRAHPSLAAMIRLDPQNYHLAADKFLAIHTGTMLEAYRAKYGASRLGVPDFTFYYLWPNLMLNFSEQEMLIAWLEPTAADRCTMWVEAYYAAELDAAQIIESVAMFSEVFAEDVALVEQVQIGMSSGTLDRGRLMMNSEWLVAHFDELVVAALVDTNE